MSLFFLFLWIQFSYLHRASSCESRNNSVERSKREFDAKYLVFPEGSNVQLVYCMTISTYAKPSGMFTIGLTAGQAWELPSRSTLSDKFEDYHRRSRRQLYRKVELLLARYTFIFGVLQNGRRLVTVHEQTDSQNFECYTALQLLVTLETFFTFLSNRGKDGKACVLKAICRAAMRSRTEIGKRPFMEEIMHAVFKLPEKSDDTDPMTEYERAYFLKENCNEAELRCPGVF